MLRWIFTREVPRPLTTLVVVVAVAMGLAACGPDSPSDPPDTTAPSRPLVADSMTIPRMLTTDDRFSTLRAALDSTGLDSVLATNGPFTLFAPPNDAFRALPPGMLDTLLSEDRQRLRELLARHIVERRVSVPAQSNTQSVVTMIGDTLSLRPARGDSAIGRASFLDRNIEAANGLLHVIDAVLRAAESDAP